MSKYYELRMFENIRLEKQKIENCEFQECTFLNCTFEECLLEDCSFTECRFIHCSIISLKAGHTNLKFADFEKCDLIGIHWQELLSAGTIADPIGRIKNCTLKYSSFFKMSFRKMDFSDNVIQDCAFEECRLEESSFKGCRLESTQFSGCDIRKADFREADGYQIDPATNKMKGARFSFPEVVGLLDGLGIQIDGL